MRVTKKIREKQLEILEETYRGAKPELHFSNPFELLIAVILSAQCTDKRVNITTARLFKKAATPAAIVALGISGLEEEIKEFGGEVPSDYDTLLKLPGVGRKTANVVTSVAFGRPAIAVDTHVFRIANRLKLAVGETPLAVEKGLMKVIPREKWSAAHHWLIYHGRRVCKANRPLCGECPLADVCQSRE